ncbi:MAG: M20/M25/M40 family metallo-hydrolase [Bryobacteraceae bacterium]|nr:M20/M25/M40 family metallo-hydrolase [Bryobacteraceae bacterium]
MKRPLLSLIFAAVALAEPGVIDPAALRADVRRLCDLGVRDTPSLASTRAARLIAEQFAAAGLEPAGDNGYFQDALFTRRDFSQARAEVSVKASGGTVRVAGLAEVGARCTEGLNITDAPAVLTTVEGLARLDAGKTRGRVLIVEGSDYLTTKADQMGRLRELAPRLTVLPICGGGPSQVRAVRQPEFTEGEPHKTPSVIAVRSAEFCGLLNPDGVTISARCAPYEQRTFALRNVLGMLRGSDPTLPALIVSGHYDSRGGPGGNDNASGVAALLEIGRALSTERPKRTILFAAWAGEEWGLLGSQHFAEHLTLPVAVNVNLDTTGHWPAGATGTAAEVTGLEYSTLGEAFTRAAELTGVQIRPAADEYFDKSDNLPFAQRGTPAVTVTAGFRVPDLHTAKDTADRLDYERMARLADLVATAALMIANNPEPPRWREIPATEKFRGAR